MKPYATATFLALVLGISQQALAENQPNFGFVNGDQLLSVCSEDDDEQQAPCKAFVAAVAEIVATNTVNGFRVCIPYERTGLGQLVEVVKKWLKDHPENLNKSAASLVAASWGEAFPCP